MLLNLLPKLLPVVGDVLDKVIPDPKAKEKAKLELAKQLQEGKLKETEQQLSAIVMEAKSTDPWTSRARPAFLYVG